MRFQPSADLAAPNYFSAASRAPVTASMRRGLDRFLQSYDRPAPWDAWVGELESLRILAAEFIGCHVDEIALPASTSVGLSSFFSGLKVRGRRIVVSSECFAGVQQVCAAQELRGATVVQASTEVLTEVIAAESPIAVVFAHVSPRTGAILQLAGC